MNCHSAITHQGGVDLSSRAAGYEALVGNDQRRRLLTYYVFPGYPSTRRS